MNYYYDSQGWLSSVEMPERTITLQPPTVENNLPIVGKLWPNWTGVEWVLVPYQISFQNTVQTSAPKSWSPFDFYSKFTDTEWIAALTAAKTDVTIQYFVQTLNAAIASNTPIRENDTRTVSGLTYMTQTVPPILTVTRVNQILER